MGRRLMDTSYKTFPEVLEKSWMSGTRMNGTVNGGVKKKVLISDESSCGNESEVTRRHDNGRTGRFSSRGNSKTWSRKRDLRSSSPSAKSGARSFERLEKSGSDEDEDLRRNFRILHRPAELLENNGETGGGGDGDVDNFPETTDEEFGRKYISNLSSASSSISWAEDAVEAELTRKIFSLWEDVQKVCTGEVSDKPSAMSSQVFDECLKWKRAFPSQDLTRFTKLSDFDAERTPTPTRMEAVTFSSRTSPAYNTSSPESPNRDCLTPNPERSPSYVSMWLSDLSKNQQRPLTHISTLDQQQNSYRNQQEASQLLEGVESLSLSESEVKHSSARPFFVKSRSGRDFHLPRNNNLVMEESEESETSHTQASQSFENSDNDTLPDDLESFHVSRRSAETPLRVQRPISSSVKGHLITPLSTSTNYLSQRQFYAGRASGAMSSREPGNRNGNPSFLSESSRSKDSGTDSQSVFSSSQYSNFFPSEHMAKGEKSPISTSYGKFSTYEQNSESSYASFSNTSAYIKEAKRTMYNNRQTNAHHGNFSPTTSNATRGFSPNMPPSKGSKDMDYEFLRRNNPNVLVSKAAPPSSTNTSSSVSTSSSRVPETKFPHPSGYKSILTQNRHWSRHSSICTNTSLLMDHFQQSASGNHAHKSARRKASQGSANFSPGESHQPPISSAYHSHRSSLLPPIAGKHMERPNNLPLSRLNAEKAKKQSRPFLYWLLDKVSPS